MFELIVWISKGWPFLIILAVLAVHYTIAIYSNVEIQVVNGVVSTVTQITGGFFVLYSIESNLGILRKQTLMGYFKAWLRSCPAIKKEPIVMNPVVAESGSSADSVSVRKLEQPKNLEDEIENLRKELQWLREDTNNQYSNMAQQYENIRQQLKKNDSQTSKFILELNNTITEVTVGGFKLELLGVLLIFYGAVCVYFA
jgi:hypothetical protein